MINPVSLFAKLGNSSSLLPIGVKDMANSVGVTSAAYITGKEVEGKDRFIDEFGSQVIWLGGIPFYKKIIDYTIYKIAKYNPKIDVRLLKDKEILKKAIEHAPTEEIKKSIEKIAQNEKNANFFKGMAMAKFVISTALTLGSYFALTTFRHKHTEKKIIEQIKKEEIKKNTEKDKNEKVGKFGKSPSFSGLGINTFKDFMFNPVKNMMIVDGGITAERLGEARNPQDFMGYFIKEGGFWIFMYFLGPAIQKYIEKKAAKSGKPIDLDIRVLQDEKFQKAFLDSGKDVKKALEDFNIEGKTDAQIYEMLFKEGERSRLSENLIAQMAHKSDIVKTIKETQDIDTQQHISIEDIKGIKSKIKTLCEHAPNKEGLEEFFKNLIKTKRWSIIKNIGASIGALGIVVPGIMVAMRFMKEENKDFQVKKQIKEKLDKEKELAKI